MIRVVDFTGKTWNRVCRLSIGVNFEESVFMNEVGIQKLVLGVIGVVSYVFDYVSHLIAPPQKPLSDG
jgi:hypothetical protein